jgi:hypothetical protein
LQGPLGVRETATLVPYCTLALGIEAILAKTALPQKPSLERRSDRHMEGTILLSQLRLVLFQFER